MAAAILDALDARPTLSSAVVALLRMLARGAPRDGTITLSEHGGADHQTVNALPVLSAGHSYLPDMLLGIYEKSATPWSVALGVRAPSGVTVSALAVSRGFSRDFRSVKGPDGRTLVGWAYSSDEIEAFESALDAWPCPPSLLLRALPTSEPGQVVGLWALAEPLDPRAALDTIRDMARALGGVAPAADVPLPGTNAANQDDRVVEVVRVNEERVYGLAEIKAAIAAKGRTK